MDWELINLCLLLAYSAFIISCVCYIGLSRIEKVLAVLFFLSACVCFGSIQFLAPDDADFSSLEAIDAHLDRADLFFLIGQIHLYAGMIFAGLFLISATVHVWQARAKLLPFFVYQSKSATTDKNDPE